MAPRAAGTAHVVEGFGGAALWLPPGAPESWSRTACQSRAAQNCAKKLEIDVGANGGIMSLPVKGHH
jgi:hypothetical protein